MDDGVVLDEATHTGTVVSRGTGGVCNGRITLAHGLARGAHRPCYGAGLLFYIITILALFFARSGPSGLHL